MEKILRKKPQKSLRATRNTFCVRAVINKSEPVVSNSSSNWTLSGFKKLKERERGKEGRLEREREEGGGVEREHQMHQTDPRIRTGG